MKMNDPRNRRKPRLGLAIAKAMARQKGDRILLGCRDIDAGNAIASKLGENIETKIDLAIWESIHLTCEMLKQVPVAL